MTYEYIRRKIINIQMGQTRKQYLLHMYVFDCLVDRYMHLLHSQD